MHVSKCNTGSKEYGLGRAGDGKLLEMFHEHLQTNVISQHHATTFLLATHAHTLPTVSSRNGNQSEYFYDAIKQTQSPVQYDIRSPTIDQVAHICLVPY